LALAGERNGKDQRWLLPRLRAFSTMMQNDDARREAGPYERNVIPGHEANPGMTRSAQYR
jgi:hypothetical protein